MEHLVAQQLKMNREAVRRLAWQNLARMVDQTDTWELLPEPLMKMLQSKETPGS
jgi:hypothetical protein